MKITIESDGSKVIIEDENAVDIHEVMDLVARALLGLSFHPDTVADGFIAKGEEYDGVREV